MNYINLTLNSALSRGGGGVTVKGVKHILGLLLCIKKNLCNIKKNTEINVSKLFRICNTCEIQDKVSKWNYEITFDFNL